MISMFLAVLVNWVCRIKIQSDVDIPSKNGPKLFPGATSNEIFS